MQNKLLNEYQEKLKAVSTSLCSLSFHESSFIKMENLFFEVLSLARTFGNNTNNQVPLTALKDIQENQYKRTQEKYSKSRQREVAIKQFRTAFKKEVSLWIKSFKSMELI